MKTFSLSVLSSLLLLLPTLAIGAQQQETEPTVEIGAKVYQERCVLCHGMQAMGEGVLPMKLKNYPNTNLLKRIRTKSRGEIHDVVTHGASLEHISDFMPPMGAELTWTELESVVDFLMLIKRDTQQGLAMLKNKSPSVIDTMDSFAGRDIYETRCVLCHGPTGEGNGRMSKIIKSPPPYNLTLSRLPKEYIVSIVTKGGEAMQRSGQMPPWGDQLNEEEIEHVVNYVMSLRK